MADEYAKTCQENTDLCGLFKDNPAARYELTIMYVGRGQGYSIMRYEAAQSMA